MSTVTSLSFMYFLTSASVISSPTGGSNLFVTFSTRYSVSPLAPRIGSRESTTRACFFFAISSYPRYDLLRYTDGIDEETLILLVNAPPSDGVSLGHDYAAFVSALNRRDVSRWSPSNCARGARALIV